MKALEGIKVVDLTRVVSGPHCTMILGDFGADVIKIEKPGAGDIGRGYAPFYEGEATYFMTHNRNKRSISLNMRHPKAKEIVLRLLKDADVLVENFKAGTLEKIGLDPQMLLEMNPRLIITRISGFGQDGPYSDQVCYDAVAQAMSGLMAITGDPDSKGGHPTNGPGGAGHRQLLVSVRTVRHPAADPDRRLRRHHGGCNVLDALRQEYLAEGAQCHAGCHFRSGGGRHRAPDAVYSQRNVPCGIGRRSCAAAGVLPGLRTAGRVDGGVSLRFRLL